MTRWLPAIPVRALVLLAFLAACDRTTSPDISARPSAVLNRVAALGTPVSANPPCTHHWIGGIGGGIGTDWFVDTLWAEGSVPGAGASVCIDQVAAGKDYPSIGVNGPASVTIAALTVTHGSILLFGSALTVTGEIECAIACHDIQLTDGSTVSANLLALDGQLTSGGSGQNVLRADIVSGATGSIQTPQDLILDKVDLSWTNDGFAGYSQYESHIEIPASTGHPTVVNNNGAIRGMTMRAGTFTANGGPLSGSILGGVFDNVNLVFSPSGPAVGITVRSSAGGATLSGALPAGAVRNGQRRGGRYNGA